MNQLTAMISGSLLLVLAGCGSSSGPRTVPDPGPEPQGLLSPITDTAAFERSIKEGLARMTSADVLDAATAAEGASYTGTYTQELNVDEADSVRYDGEHLVVAPRRFSACCFIFDDGLVPPDNVPPPGAIRILATDPGNGTAELVSEIELESGVSVQGMYQTGDTLFALTAERFFGSYGQFWADIAIWAPEQLGIELYDLNDAANPVLEFEAKIDGVFVESRRVGNTVYIVTRFTPSLDGLHYYVTTAQQQVENELLLSSATLEDLLPKVTVAGQSRLLVQPENCYVTTTDDTDNNPVLTSITAVPLDDPENFTTACYNESAYGVYVSENAFYLAELRPDTALQRDITRIHKFAAAGTSLDYRGSADIEGTVWRGNQSDFRLSEHNGDLRVLASQFDWASDDFVDHVLYILRESTTTPDLEIISTLPNNARPQEIGQVNE
ncbi:MAG TPA: beta-propeller domain-containing protein, partial [Gammaproteobacteria bacterium]|nr:beta-propeller domain-containing protein [Gammaproteobacteria bacterium]